MRTDVRREKEGAIAQFLLGDVGWQERIGTVMAQSTVPIRLPFATQ